jgi:uncharacterized membrane protein required for colicin V production
MHWADTTIIVILLIGAGFGAMNGFLWQLSRILSFGVSLFACIYFHEWASNTLAEVFFKGADVRIPRALAYPIVFLAVYIVFASGTLLLERCMRAAKLQPLNRLAGAGLGAVKTGLILGTIFIGMANYPHERTQEIMEKSVLAPALADGMNIAISAVPAQYREELQNGLKNLRETARAKLEEMRSRTLSVRP